jgi:hypothetical protein
VFVRTGTAWTQAQKLVASDAPTAQGFGWSVGLDGNKALIGAPSALEGGVATGVTYLFVLAGSMWEEQARITAGDGALGDRFGVGVAIDDDRLFVGADQDDVGGGDFSGSAYLFDLFPAASAVFRNDVGGTNRAGYDASIPVLGQVWLASVDNTGTGNVAAAILGFEYPLEVWLPGIGGWLLIDPASPAGEILQLSAGAGAGMVFFGALVPGDPSLVGLNIATQGLGFGGTGGLTLHNAFDLFVGL